MAQTFSADEYLALNRHVSDVKADLYQIAQLLSRRLGPDDTLSQEAARALYLIDSLNSRLLRRTEKLSHETATDDAA